MDCSYKLLYNCHSGANDDFDQADYIVEANIFYIRITLHLKCIRKIMSRCDPVYVEVSMYIHVGTVVIKCIHYTYAKMCFI